MIGLQRDIDAQGPQASITGSRRIHPTRVMDRFSHSTFLQLTGMAQSGEGWLRVRAATEEEDDAKKILKRRKKLLAQLNEDETSRDKPGPPTVSVRNEHILAGRLATPTLNDITMRNAVCWELELTPLGSVCHGTEKKECFGRGQATE